MFDLNLYMRMNRQPNGLVKLIECADGFSISVQGSEFNYSSPRKNNMLTYSEVECGFPSSVPEFIMDYAEQPEFPTDTVYAFVPVKLVEQLIDLHNVKLVEDLVTGELYNPMVEFDRLLNSPEVVDQMVRMKEERGRGWPMHPDDKGENV